ncbi:hypothetical protein FA13DRAFT_1776161 [Coprinellus micaceus]|uniref:MYND-type domain-containing protein n=1 Tax=Coprinellus micaceus TaxID=71717 RepID=A0A4Y7T3H8_COPMI|nr:hypothetical protein FA13DRAFT_1776161 [Coprinellus micaceus]
MPVPRSAKYIGRDVIKERRERLLSQAQTLWNRDGLTAVGVLMGERLDMGVLENILDGFDSAPPRRRIAKSNGRPTRLDEQGADDEDIALAALKDLSLVFKGLYTALRTGKLQKLKLTMDRCIGVVHERWGGITQWLIYCARNVVPGDTGYNWDRVIDSCTWILEPILFYADDDPVTHDLVARPPTIDFVFCLLRITDPGTERPATHKSYPNSLCSIAKVFAMSVMSTTGHYIQSHLNEKSPHTRRDVVRSIVRRIQDVSATPRHTPDDMSRVSCDLLNLIPGACIILTRRGPGEAYGVSDVLFEGARALSCAMEDVSFKNSALPDYLTLDAGINQLVSLATWPRTPPRAMERLFEAGIIPCIIRSLPHTNRSDPRHRGIEEPAYHLLPFLTDSRIFSAVKTGGADLEPLMKELERYPKSKVAVVEPIYNAYSLALRCCKSAFQDRKSPIEMCYNLNHEVPREGSRDCTTLKTCSVCRVVFYCSEVCQREDWAAFHSEECTRGAERWRPRLTVAGVTERLERDRLMILEALANRFLPPPTEIVRRGSGGIQNASEDSSVRIHTFDLAGGLYQSIATGEASPPKRFVEYESMTLPSYFQKYEDVLGDRTRARLSRCAEDIKHKHESTLLVAGTFTAHKVCICICAKMVYNPDSEVGERYRVVWHACSILCLPLWLFGI